MVNDKQHSAVNIKQRIIGAIVLIALAVIIVPMLLDLRKDYDSVISGSNIPPKPDDFRIEVFQFDKDADIKVPAPVIEQIVNDVAGPASAEPADNVIADNVPSVEQSSARERVSELRDRINDSKDGSVAQAGQAAAQAWVVQLASLTRQQNALTLRDRVRKMGLHAFVVSSQVDGKTMYRVLVGPELLRSNAENVRQRLQQEIKLNGLVMTYKR
jgi:DedD protein